jgi:hypothetical protein
MNTPPIIRFVENTNAECWDQYGSLVVAFIVVARSIM